MGFELPRFTGNSSDRILQVRAAASGRVGRAPHAGGNFGKNMFFAVSIYILKYRDLVIKLSS